MDMSGYAEEYINPEIISSDSNNPTTARILDSGQEVESLRFNKKQVVFSVEILGRKYKYRPSKTSVRVLNKQLGAESTAWVGKVIKLVSVIQSISGVPKKTVMVV